MTKVGGEASSSYAFSLEQQPFGTVMGTKHGRIRKPAWHCSDFDEGPLMFARDMMRQDIDSVSLHTPARDVARLLLDKGISAVPVIDDGGKPLGMVSGEDLAGPRDDRAGKVGAWWLRLAAGDDPALGQSLHLDRKAGEIMSQPVIAVGETTEAHDIARLLVENHIGDLPVLKDDRVIGMVGRAELLHALAAERTSSGPPGQTRSHATTLLSDAVVGLEEHFVESTHPRTESESACPPEPGLTAQDFRHLVDESENQATRRREEDSRIEAEQRRKAVSAMIDRHLTDERWHSTLQRARKAAEMGAKEFELLRFPSELCTDGGRAINAPEADWPTTLRGEAAEVYRHWEDELKPQGFRLTARVVDFPGGIPGDVGLFLVWGEATAVPE